MSSEQSHEQLKISTASSKIQRHHGVLGETNHSAAGFSIFTSFHSRPKAISQMATHSDSKSLKMDYNIGRTRLYRSQKNGSGMPNGEVPI